MKALTAISIAVGILAGSLAQAATTSTQYQVSKDPRIADLGLAPQGEVRSVTLALAVKNQAAMETHAASTVDPSSPNYKKFLTPAQVAALYGQDATSIAAVVNFLQSQGLSVTQVYADNLFISVQGTNAQLAAAFGSPIHTYQAFGQTYEAPVSAVAVPAQLAGMVRAVHGLSNRPLRRSNAVRQPAAAVPLGEASVTANIVPTPTAPATGTPGSFTTADLANSYNVNPLYKAGITGAGKTIGITTLAGYNQSDAYAYWAALGLNVSKTRITDVNVDGGPSKADGPGSEGAGETTLDVEQSGGVAPGANMRVYLAPNTDKGFLDAFAQPINENLVDTLSISWGSPEVYDDAATLNSFHTVFLQAALQGIPVIAATGDAGAYDINRSYAYPDCTSTLTVDFPASDPLVLGAGGTTAAHVQKHAKGTITIPTERAWAWDYLRSYIVQYYGQSLYYSSYFAVGGGGGVSINYNRPGYQTGLTGVASSAPAQTLYCKPSAIGASGTAYIDLVDMPANFAGRNLPDVSLNADPYSGYLVYQNGWGSGSGGTSFVSPQLNGIFTLIASGTGGRLGQLQPQLYSMFKTQGYNAGSPFRAITDGTDFYYSSKANYNPATGLGTLDVSNLARAFGVKF